MITEIGVGDVWAVGTDGWAADVIRAGGELAGKDTPANHVLIVHHVDAAGRWWGVEGRPGGVGWCDARQYLHDSQLSTAGNSDHPLPRTDQQRQGVAAAAAALLGTPYDWAGGIAADFLGDVRARGLAEAVQRMWGWRDPASPERAPGHVVCSSLAAWVHRSLDIAAPAGAAEIVQPADWWLFNAAIEPPAPSGDEAGAPSAIGPVPPQRALSPGTGRQ